MPRSSKSRPRSGGSRVPEPIGNPSPAQKPGALTLTLRHVDALQALIVLSAAAEQAYAARAVRAIADAVAATIYGEPASLRCAHVTTLLAVLPEHQRYMDAAAIERVREVALWIVQRAGMRELPTVLPWREPHDEVRTWTPSRGVGSERHA